MKFLQRVIVMWIFLLSLLQVLLGETGSHAWKDISTNQGHEVCAKSWDSNSEINYRIVPNDYIPYLPKC